ncbi:hypothetical protein Trydic_g14282 [Trypoxylus dichotomus]
MAVHQDEAMFFERAKLRCVHTTAFRRPSKTTDLLPSPPLPPISPRNPSGLLLQRTDNVLPDNQLELVGKNRSTNKDSGNELYRREEDAGDRDKRGGQVLDWKGSFSGGIPTVYDGSTGNFDGIEGRRGGGNPRLGPRPRRRNQLVTTGPPRLFRNKTERRANGCRAEIV